jgi:hypothetical protein
MARTKETYACDRSRSDQRFGEEKKLKPFKSVSRRSQALILSTDLGPLINSIYIYPKTRPSFTIHYLPLYPMPH